VKHHVSVTTLLVDGTQLQRQGWPHPYLSGAEQGQNTLVAQAVEATGAKAVWHIGIISSANGFIVTKFYGDGTRANELVDGEEA
jgi:hypothetical protein